MLVEELGHTGGLQRHFSSEEHEVHCRPGVEVDIWGGPADANVVSGSR